MHLTREPTTPDSKKTKLALDTKRLDAARHSLDMGAVVPDDTPYRADIIQLLNDSLATELVCVLRYKRHHFTAHGMSSPAISLVTTDDWEITVLEVIRGEEAWNMALATNQFNEAPAEGMEYIVAKVHVRYIGTEDEAAALDGTFFKSTGSASVLYDAPPIVDPEPQLEAYLYPGGEFEGWITVQVAVGETGVMLVFEPWFDFSGDNKRFIALE